MIKRKHVDKTVEGDKNDSIELINLVRVGAAVMTSGTEHSTSFCLNVGWGTVRGKVRFQ